MEKIIEDLVDSFYDKAIKDILIGYHFRKIQTGKALTPSLSDFAHHLPRIKIFWKSQLINNFKSPEVFNLKESHMPLKIRKGELDRFVLLFNETISHFEKLNPDMDIFDLWRKKILFFQIQFRKFV